MTAKKVAKKEEEESVDAPAVTGAGAEHETAKADSAESYSFAVNAVKLNRAKAHVSKTQPDLKGNALVAAVKARYVEIGGLLLNDKPVRGGKRGGRVVNMADDDGSSEE